MKLNNEYRFGVVPKVNTPRSRFLMHQNIRTTFNAGKLIPFMVDSDIMPGDTFKIKGNIVCRMSTPIYPIMDNIFLDVRFFFVPHRLVWDHWKEFMGENTTGSWAQTTEYTIPQLAIYAGTSYAAHKIAKGDNLQYMGIPIGYPKTINSAPATAALCTTKVSALPLRALQLIWNDWFRDENVAAPYYVYKGDSDRYYGPHISNEWGTYQTNVQTDQSECPPVYKFKDMFNSNLLAPQKGAAITLPIGDVAPIVWGEGYNSPSAPIGETVGIESDGIAAIGHLAQIYYGTSTTAQGTIMPENNDKVYTLKADLSNAIAATINAQRFAFASQRILEAMARGGTRYCELIKSIWNVEGPMSAVLQRPEYCFGKRLPININQVVQTSSTDSTSPQGNTAAFSLTVDTDYYGTKSFTEHGTLMGVLCVRQEHSYSQGIARMWNRKRRLDFFWPQLQFIGEQGTLNKEIYADGSTNDEEVFGFNERFIELKAKTNINTGAFSPDHAQSLDVWHLGDDYSSLPVLSDAWRRETKDYIDRVLAVTSAVEDQFLMDSRWEFDCTRAVALHAVPGLLDHF